ncbi:MAG: 3-phosphoshikimate 1-carboxyvinyltransferase [Oligoflexia bacterium]|nr:3-phosphoshikimate 1-carboxyvinyltransferase [Oligoflexia bacterium]
MTTQSVARARALRGKPRLPGDKSISHRSLILGALAHGTTEIIDALDAGDTRSTERCLLALGVKIRKSGNKILVEGIGSGRFAPPADILDCGNSGTTLRLLMGALAGRSVHARLTGDASLVKRPMRRIAEPLRMMGADIELTRQDFAPITIRPAAGRLQAIDYELKIASAQLKSALLLAALSADGTTSLRGEILSRDHTERLLPHFGVPLQVSPTQIRLLGGQKLEATRVRVPGDPSAAAFWMAGACMIPDAFVEIENVSLNPTRVGFLTALKRMGAMISTELTEEAPEPIGKVTVESGELRGIHVAKSDIPGLIDELPLLAVVATQAQGVTHVEGAEELRVKESDRLEAIATCLRAMGAEIEVKKDGFRIFGPQTLKAARVESFQDHRIAMALSIAGLVADDSEGPTIIENSECVSISYPDFYPTLQTLTQGGSS